MHKRVFYVINLDRKRMLILFVTLLAGLLFAFTAGFRMGHGDKRAPFDLARMGQGDSDLEARRAALRSEIDADSNALDGEQANASDALEHTEQGSSRFERQANDSGQMYLKNQGQYTDANDAKRNQQALDYRPGSEDHSARLYDRNTETTRKYDQARNSNQLASQKNSSGSKKTAAAKEVQSQRIPKERSLAKKSASNKSQPQVARKGTSANNSAAKQQTALLDSKGSGIRLSNLGSSRSNTSNNTAKSNAKQNTSAQKSAPVISVTENKKPAASASVFALQTGSFRSKEAANRMQAGLQKQGFASRVIKKNKNYVVQVGRSSDRKELWAIENKLRKQRYSPMRVRLGK